MNNEDLHRLAKDFRHLRLEMIERSNQILSAFETALKQSSTKPPSNEHMSYLDFGIRITEGDYVASIDTAQAPSQPSLFFEGEKRPAARSITASQQTDLNNGGTPVISRSNTKKLVEPIHRSLTATKKMFVRTSSMISRHGSLGAGHQSPPTRVQEITAVMQPEKIDSAMSPPLPRFQQSEPQKQLVANALAAMKPQLAIVNERNSAFNSFSSVESSHTTPSLFTKKLPVQIGNESSSALIKSHSSTFEQEASILVAIDFGNYAVPRYLRSATSSLKANASADSFDPVPTTSSLLATPKSEVTHQQFAPSLTRKRGSIPFQPPLPPMQKSMSGETQPTGASMSATPKSEAFQHPLGSTMPRKRRSSLPYQPLRRSSSEHTHPDANSLNTTPKSSVVHQFADPSISRTRRRSSVPFQPPLSPQKNLFGEAHKNNNNTTQTSLVYSTGSHSARRRQVPEDLKTSPPNFLEQFFLFPAYDRKGRRIGLESLSAFGNIHAKFYVNGIHPRSVFSNLWDLSMGFIMFLLLWIIPFVAAYNPVYEFCNVNMLAISISVIFLCDSVVSLITPELVNGDFTFDLSEYEKARPTLAVWLHCWLRTKFFINLLSMLHNEYFLFLCLVRGLKLCSHFCRCPTMINLAWRLDDLVGTSVSSVVPLTSGILLFIHFNACTIFMMGRMAGFVGWTAMWPLVDSATLFETYIWTFYKAVGNMFPTSFNPWTPWEQIASLVYIMFAAVVYAVFLGAISSAVMAVNPSGRLFDQKIGELRDYIRSKDLSKETEARLLTYYETRYRGKYFEEDALLSNLNDSLKAEILLQNTRKLIINVPFLKRSVGDGRDELFIGRIAAALLSINFIPGDYVTKQGDSGSDMYFILNGKAEVYVNEKLAVILGAGAYFGEIGLITKTLRTATVQAVLPSLMYRLTYTDFHKILDDFSDMRLLIEMLAEERATMNNDELHQIAADFRRLRTEMMERADQILSLFDSALRRTSVVRASSEHINYLDLGIRITEGDYMASKQSTKPSSHNSLFAEEEKKSAARSLVVSQQTDLNSGGFQSMSRSKSKKVPQPLARTPMTQTLKHSVSIVSRRGTVLASQAGSSTRALETSLTPRLENSDAPSTSTAPPLPQKLLANEPPKNLMINVLSVMKPHLSMVTEANSAQASFSSIEPTMVALSPEPTSAKVFPPQNIRRESVTESIKSQPPTQDKEIRRISTEFKYMQRFMPFYSSSLRGNGSQNSSMNSASDSGFSFATPPQSESAPQKPGPRIVSRTRESSLRGPPPLPFSGSGDLQKKVTQHTLLISSDNHVAKRALTTKKLQGPPPSFLKYFFLFPAFDHKGRRITLESLAAFGSLEPEFHVNGIHSRSLFSNIWDLTLGFVMFVLFWLIPFVAAYNPIYEFCNVNVLSISISFILLCDSAVALMTPQLLRGESSFDVGEYEKARPVLPVWLSHWFRSKFAINLITIIPFSIFFKSHMHNEFLTFISLIRGFKLWSHFCRCPTIVNLAWRVDDLAGTSVSRIIPLTSGIFWFIHCNSCTIFMMGRMTGFVGWSAMWPLLDSATLFETYIWTFYKAVGNMFPTSFK
ncbi:Potassium voltage-gated channel sub H member 7 [Chytriomyces hyalinus]|nr:Potassium voltage-gated channel sub H member 7 [Chytriomyces hyalinus]